MKLNRCAGEERRERLRPSGGQEEKDSRGEERSSSVQRTAVTYVTLSAQIRADVNGQTPDV